MYTLKVIYLAFQLSTSWHINESSQQNYIEMIASNLSQAQCIISEENKPYKDAIDSSCTAYCIQSLQWADMKELNNVCYKVVEYNYEILNNTLTW